MRKQRKSALQELQDRRDSATTQADREHMQSLIDDHFMGTKKKKKQQKKKKKYIPNDDWDY